MPIGEFKTAIRGEWVQEIIIQASSLAEAREKRDRGEFTKVGELAIGGPILDSDDGGYHNFDFIDVNQVDPSWVDYECGKCHATYKTNKPPAQEMIIVDGAMTFMRLCDKCRGGSYRG